jgi:adenylate cyclase
VMAIFGAPIPHRDHPLRAVKTALAMRERFELFNADRARRGLETIGAGIGVSVGEVVAGTVGTEDRMEYTVVGDSVNLAARLESNAKAGQILMSQRTWEKVQDQVDARPLGLIKVKGKEEEVEIYELVGLAEKV